MCGYFCLTLFLALVPFYDHTNNLNNWGFCLIIADGVELEHRVCVCVCQIVCVKWVWRVSRICELLLAVHSQLEAQQMYQERKEQRHTETDWEQINGHQRRENCSRVSISSLYELSLTLWWIHFNRNLVKTACVGIRGLFFTTCTFKLSN